MTGDDEEALRKAAEILGGHADGMVATLDDAVAAFNPTERIIGQTIIRVRP
jgi:hypothetical protein